MQNCSFKMIKFYYKQILAGEIEYLMRNALEVLVLLNVALDDILKDEKANYSLCKRLQFKPFNFRVKVFL